MFKDKLTKKVLGIVLSIVVIQFLMINIFVSLKLGAYSEKKVVERLNTSAIVLSKTLDVEKFLHGNKEVLEHLNQTSKKLDMRITIVGLDGVVLFDSILPYIKMENHSDRSELIKAFTGEVGVSARVSDSLHKSMKYLALPIYLNRKTVGALRVSVPYSFIETESQFLHQIVLISGFVASILVIIIGFFISIKVTKPILKMQEAAQRFAEGDFSKKLRVESDDEMGELAKSLNHMAQELQDQIHELKKMDKIKTEFVANVSHELKTPLTSIKGFVETLQDGAIEEKENAERFLSIIGKHTDRLGNIVDDLLTLSSLENEQYKMNLQKERFNIEDLIEEILISLNKAIIEKGLNLSFSKLNENLEIFADRMRIEEALVNVIDNAIKYTPKNGKIDISITREEKNILVVVADTGVGIAKESQSRIFERFYRADKARSRELGGTGLGLSIVKHIVQVHKGKVFLESEKNQGTKVTILLPILSMS